MGKTRDALLAWSAKTRTEYFRLALPRVVALSRSRLAQGKIAGHARREEPLAAVQARLIAAARTGLAADLSGRDLRRTGDAIWDGPAPLSADQTVLSRLLAEIEGRGSRPAVFRIVAAYLGRFDPNLPALDKVAAFLKRAVQAHDWLWRSRATQYALFSPPDGPRTIASIIMRSDEPVPAILADSGLEQAGEASNYAESAFRSACALVAKSPAGSAEPAQRRLMSWGERPQGAGRDRLTYAKSWPDLAGALLLPWEARDPNEEHKTRLSDFAIAVAGDPRSNRRAWGAETVRAEAVLKRWLIEKAFHQFFAFVDEVADPRPWAYRKAFWSSYLEAGQVTEAWAVLGAYSAQLAREAARTSKDRSLLSFAQLGRGGGRGPRQSALLVRIGKLIIADWSHDGAYNIWSADARSAPSFGKDNYTPYELRSADSGYHYSPERFGWQRKLADRIYDETGLRTSPATWRPRDR